MSDKKDFSKKRLSNFLAARLRAKGHDETQDQKSRHDSGKASPNAARNARRLPQHLENDFFSRSWSTHVRFVD